MVNEIEHSGVIKDITDQELKISIINRNDNDREVNAIILNGEKLKNNLMNRYLLIILVIFH